MLTRRLALLTSLALAAGRSVGHAVAQTRRPATPHPASAKPHGQGHAEPTETGSPASRATSMP